MRRAICLLLALCAFGSLRSFAQTSVAEQYLFQAANAERQQRGLSPLHWDETLFLAAHAHAYEMAARRSISHQYPGEPELGARGKAAGAHFSVIAENVAEAPTARTIHSAWMESEGHRENLLDARLTAIAISVIERDGELYAVQDFARSVDSISFDEQETLVSQLLLSASPLKLDTAETFAARQTCSLDTGYAGPRRPWFVMRFTAAELNRLPEALKTRLASGRYHEAAVGACAMPAHGEPFSAYSIAVLLWP